MKKIRKAVIPAAGFGTRFLPITKTIPKEMLAIVDRPALDYIIKEAINSGITEILVITNSSKWAIEAFYKPNKKLEEFLTKNDKLVELDLVREKFLADIYFINQEKQLGLGHAISLAKDFVGNESFAVLLGDDVFDCEKPALKQLMDEYKNEDDIILGTMEIDKKDCVKFGMCKGKKISKDLYELESVVEKPSIENSPSNIAISGRYIFSPKIFDYIDKKKINNKEIQITDSINRYIKNNYKCYAKLISGNRYDIGSKVGYIKANVEFGLKNDNLKDDILDFIKKIK